MDEKTFLDSYDKGTYEKPSVSCDIIALTTQAKPNKNKRKRDTLHLQILLNKRDQFPFKDKWGLVGGFLGMTETLDETVMRKLGEKTGITNVYAEQLFTFSDVKRDPRMRIISATYLSLMNKNEIDHSLIDGERLDWFELKIKTIKESNFDKEGERKGTYEIQLVSERDEIELKAKIQVDYVKKGRSVSETVTILESDLAFDHAKIIFTGMKRLKNKIFYTDLVFNLLPVEFPFTKLQDVYELITGEKQHKSNFRRMLEPYLEETEVLIEEGAFRPSMGYRYNFKPF